jgi:methionyl-tRNA synthetase
VLYNAAEAGRLLALLLSPVMPEAADKMLAQLGVPPVRGAAWVDGLTWGELQPGTQTALAGPLFPRLERAD